MDVPLSPRAFRLLDGATKVVGLVTIAAALGGAAAPHALSVGAVGVGVGVVTVFLSPREEAASAPSDGNGSGDGGDTRDTEAWRPVTRLGKRLWHSRLARLGGLLWLVAFLVAGSGVLLEHVGDYGLATDLFAVSGPVGLVGVAAIVVAGGLDAVTSIRG